MKGMDEVGRLFNANELIVAEVLQSAEAMKAAVTHLEPYMEKAEAATRGKIVLATVKGDVHDIGKNLVEIILANNGFQVVNLGHQGAARAAGRRRCSEHKPDIIGLSGLLVKSAQQMVATAEDLRAPASRCRCSSAARRSSATSWTGRSPRRTRGTVAYAQDAMSGLELAKQIVDPAGLEQLKEELADRREKLAQEAAERPGAVPVAPAHAHARRCGILERACRPRRTTSATC